MERRLAAILAADVVGYTRLMGTDESGTFSRIKNLRENLLKPLIEEEVGEDIGQMLPGDDPNRWTLKADTHKLRM